MGHYITKATRAAVYARCGRRCAMCGTDRDLTIDHIMPRALGGTDELDNLQILCRGHNTRKGRYLTAEARKARDTKLLQGMVADATEIIRLARLCLETMRG